MGTFDLSVALAGNVDGDRDVGEDDRVAVRDLRRNGQYPLEADAGHDGCLTAFDYTIARCNVGDGVLGNDSAGVSLPYAVVPETRDFDSNTFCNVTGINPMMAQRDLPGAGASVSLGNQFDLDGDNDIDESDITQWLFLTGTGNNYGSPIARGDIDQVGATSPTTRTLDITDSTNFLTDFTDSRVTWEADNFNGNNDVDVTDFSSHFLPNVLPPVADPMAPARSSQNQVPSCCLDSVGWYCQTSADAEVELTEASPRV